MIIVLFLLSGVVFFFILNNTKFSYHMQAVGSNEPVARNAGIKVGQVKLKTFVYGGLFIGMASMLTISQSGSVGAQYVLDSEPDGYTIFFTAESLGTQRVMDISNMSYADFSPIACVANDPKVIVVAKDCEYGTIEELLDAIKANPGKIQMSYTGPGGSGHVQALIMNQFGYEPALTAYASGAEGITAVLGGQVVFTNSNFSTVKSYIESGDLKVLTVCSTQPIAALPDVPTLASVIPGSDALMDIPYTPLSLLVDKDVPEEIQNTLRIATKAAVEDPDFNAWMETNCVDKLYEKYTSIEEITAFYTQWESTVSWLLFDAGAAKLSPEDFGIARP